MIQIKEKKNCCGCGGCFNICPSKAITMRRDGEGFLYPEIEHGKCTHCDLCEAVCPQLNAKPETSCRQHGYLVQHKDDIIRKQSTSGGAFTAIAETVLRNGGIVFGSAFDSNFKVCHCFAENVEELEKFRNSKYVQSETGVSFLQVKIHLDNGRQVCFSGTPCQIEGLKCFLKKEYDNLITVDVVCRSVPSPVLLEKYIKWQRNNFPDGFEKIVFRDKHYGYNYSNLSLFDKHNKKIYHAGIESDYFLRAFFTDVASRPSCYNCSFKKRYRQSDITLWDCLDARPFAPEFDDDRGTTRVLLHSQKGVAFFEHVKPSIRWKEIDADRLTARVKEMIQPISCNPMREAFMRDMAKLDENELFHNYFRDGFKVLLERKIRIFCKRRGLYSMVKRLKPFWVKKGGNIR